MATKPILVDLDFGSVAKVTNLQAPVAAGDAATKSYVDGLVEGLAWKDQARVSTQANTTIASPGAAIDGITMVANDRVLVRAQTTVPENGIYIWNGAAVAMTRTNDASTFDELESAVITVDEGTSAGTTWRQSAINGVIGTNNVTWAAFGTSAPAASETTAGIAEIATQAETDAGTDDLRFVTPLKLATYAGRVRKFNQVIGDASATSIAVNHNLNTRALHIGVFQDTGTFDLVDCEVELTTVNQATFKFNSAPALNALRVTVIG